MTQEEKQLLLKDICARLPYGVKLDVEWIAPLSGSPEHSMMELSTFEIEVIKTSIELGEEGDRKDGKMCGFVICDDGKHHFVNDFMCKPYLRPMSSMTEEEKNEIKKDYNFSFYGNAITLRYYSEGYWDEDTEANSKDYMDLIDWLNAHHFDYRGLIEKGLALEAPEDMYKIE